MSDITPERNFPDIIDERKMSKITLVLFILCVILISNFDSFVDAQSSEAIAEYCKDNWEKAPQLCSNHITEESSTKNAHDLIAEKNLEKDQQRIKQFQLDMQNIVCPPGTEKQSSGLDVFCVSENDSQGINTNSNLNDMPPIIFIGFVLFIIIIIIVVIKKAVGSEDSNSTDLYSGYDNKFKNLSVPAKSNKFFAKNHSNKARETIPAKLRHEIFQRDSYRCTECGATNKETRLHIDHIFPFSKGGSSERHNLQTLCNKCNLAKWTRRWVGGRK